MKSRTLKSKEIELYQHDDGTVKLIIWPAGFVTEGDEQKKPQRKAKRKGKAKA